MKIRFAAAKKGHQLLKKKALPRASAPRSPEDDSLLHFRSARPAALQADALTMRYRQILKRILATKIKMGELMKESAFALVQAKYVTGDGVKHTIFDAVESASIKARARRAPRPQRAAGVGPTSNSGPKKQRTRKCLRKMPSTTPPMAAPGQGGDRQRGGREAAPLRGAG